MKTSQFISPLLSILLTAFVLTHSSWLVCKKDPHARGHHEESRVHARVEDPLATEAGRRWRNCQPNHWRGYVLQR
jgi:hypothetical protein